MRYVADLYATFLITVEVEAENETEAEDKLFTQVDFNEIAARSIAMNNGLPELEYELIDICGC